MIGVAALSTPALVAVLLSVITPGCAVVTAKRNIKPSATMSGIELCRGNPAPMSLPIGSMPVLAPSRKKKTPNTDIVDPARKRKKTVDSTFNTVKCRVTMMATIGNMAPRASIAVFLII